MHIVMLAGAMELGGAETHIATLCRALAANGHRITLITSGGVLAEQLVTDGVVRAVYLPCDRKSLFAMVRCRLALRRLCRRDAPDVIHAHTRLGARLAKGLYGRRQASGGGQGEAKSETVDGQESHDNASDAGLRRLDLCPAGLRRSSRRARRVRIPCVVTVHADYPCRGLRARLSYFGDMTLCVSGDLCKTVAARFGVPRKQILLTRNGIDCVHYAPRPMADEGRRIVCVCRMERDASGAVDALLACAQEIRRHLPDAVFSFYGTGVLLPFYRRKAAILNKSAGKDYLFFCGAIADSAQAFARADLVVASSRACLEAMACGRCVVAAGPFGYGGLIDARGSLSFAVDTNFTFRRGRVCEPNVLARDVVQFFSLPRAERDAIGHANRAFAVTHYPSAKLAQDALCAYRRACAPRLLLLGYYGFGNFGDEVSLAATADLCHRLGYRVGIVSHRPTETRRDLGFACVRRYAFFAVRRYDALVFGGGTVLQDETSCRSLFYYLCWARLAKRVMLYANGLGPFRYSVSRAAVKVSLADARILVRDARSLALCRELGLDAGRCDDATALLPWRATLNALPPLYDAAGVVCGAPSPFCRPFDLIAPRAQYGMGDACFLHPDGRCLIFTCLQDCDLPLCFSLAAQYGGFVCRVTSHAQMCALIAHPNLCEVWSQRYHLLYYAKRYGVTTHALCQTPKFLGLGEG